MQKYFTCFDSDDRQSLLDLYYEQASFSYTINRFDQRKNQTKFDYNLLTDSRNLLRIRDDQSAKSLRQGRAQIVTALSNLPKTEHILESFKIDVPVFQDNFIILNINGFYKIRKTFLKAFSRNFLIASTNNTFAIVNDLLSITSPSAENIAYVKNLFKNDPNSQDINYMESVDDFGMSDGNFIEHNIGSNSTISSINQMNAIGNQMSSNVMSRLGPINSTMNQANLQQQQNTINNNQMSMLNNNNLISPTMNLQLQQNAMSTPLNRIATTSALSSSDQELIIKRFAEITGMNPQFSKQCLQENLFNAEKALDVFKTLNNLGQIPQEAFQK